MSIWVVRGMPLIPGSGSWSCWMHSCKFCISFLFLPCTSDRKHVHLCGKNKSADTWFAGSCDISKDPNKKTENSAVFQFCQSRHHYKNSSVINSIRYYIINIIDIHLIGFSLISQSRNYVRVGWGSEFFPPMEHELTLGDAVDVLEQVPESLVSPSDRARSLCYPINSNFIIIIL